MFGRPRDERVTTARKKSFSHSIERDFAMIRYSVAVAILMTFASTKLHANDYLLRLEILDTSEQETQEARSTQKILQSYEVAVQDNRPFFTRIAMGKETTTLKGKLEEAGFRKFLVKVNYRNATKTDESVPTIDGKRRPISNVIAIDTAPVLVELGKPFELGHSTSLSGAMSLPVTYKWILTIEHFESSAE